MAFAVLVDASILTEGNFVMIWLRTPPRVVASGMRSFEKVPCRGPGGGRGDTLMLVEGSVTVSVKMVGPAAAAGAWLDWWTALDRVAAHPPVAARGGAEGAPSEGNADSLLRSRPVLVGSAASCVGAAESTTGPAADVEGPPAAAPVLGPLPMAPCPRAGEPTASSVGPPELACCCWLRCICSRACAADIAPALPLPAPLLTLEEEEEEEATVALELALTGEPMGAGRLVVVEAEVDVAGTDVAGLLL